MQTSYTIKDEDMKQIVVDKSLQTVKEKLEEEIASMIETRTVEVDCSDNANMHQQYKGYVMALEDLWVRLYGTQLDIGQDIEPVEWDEVQ